MIDLSDDYIKHLPNERIPREDMCCLGYCDNYDYWLVFEEGEFRVYNYEWWSYDSIVDGGHETEDWYDDVDNYFSGGDDCFDKDTCEYMSLKFENNNPEGMAYEIWEACDELEDRFSITNNIDEGPNVKLINFIADHIKNKVYLYYK